MSIFRKGDIVRRKGSESNLEGEVVRRRRGDYQGHYNVCVRWHGYGEPVWYNDSDLEAA